MSLGQEYLSGSGIALFIKLHHIGNIVKDKTIFQKEREHLFEFTLCSHPHIVPFGRVPYIVKSKARIYYKAVEKHMIKFSRIRHKAVSAALAHLPYSIGLLTFNIPDKLLGLIIKIAESQLLGLLNNFFIPGLAAILHPINIRFAP